MKFGRILAWPTAAVAVAGASVSPAQGQDQPRIFEPSGDWTLNSDNESCTLSRRFGSADDGVQFYVQAFSPGGAYRVILRGNPLPQRESGLLELSYGFRPDPGLIPVSGVLNKSNGLPMVTFRAGLGTSTDAALDPAQRPAQTPESIAARVAAIDEFVVAFSRGRPLALQLGPISEPFNRLAACAFDLPGKWGLDTAVQRSLSRLPVPIDQPSWLGPGTFPWSYLRNAQSLMVHIRMIVDENGAPTACVVQAPKTQSGAEALACREIMKTARFDPALDLSGNPVPSYFATSIFYATPRRNGPTSRGGTLVGGP